MLQTLAAGISADAGPKPGYTEMGHFWDKDASIVMYSMMYVAVAGTASTGATSAFSPV